MYSYGSCSHGHLHIHRMSGATFYVSYFNTAVIFAGLVAAVIKVYHDNGEDSTLGISLNNFAFRRRNCGKYPKPAVCLNCAAPSFSVNLRYLLVILNRLLRS